MADGLRLNWTPPGPVSAAFMQCRDPVLALMGPIGGGKTSTCLIKLLHMAGQQAPSPVDGLARFKFCVVRDTYRQLWSTTIPTWWRWVPQATGAWEGSNGAPARHTIKFAHGPKVVELIAEFVAIGENRVEDVLRGYEPSAFYLNEADLLAPDVLTYALSRAVPARYPPMEHGGASWSGVLCDFNAPDTENYLYSLFVDAPAPGWRFFRQPSGLSPAAENLSNLPPEYYARQSSGRPEWFVRRFVRNEFGFSRDGKPVYPEFNDALHVAAEALRPHPKLPLIIGADAGRTPALVICQHLPGGRWLVLEEIVGTDLSAKAFAAELNRVLAARYAGMPATAWCDPAATFKHDTDEASWRDIMAAATHLSWKAAPTNALLPRLEAVRLQLARLIDGRDPGILVSPTAKVLRKGFNSGYRYKRVRVTGADRFEDLPDKHAPESHVHDALQYALLGGGEYHDVMGRRERVEQRRAQRAGRAVTAYDALARGWGAAHAGGARAITRSARPA